MEYEFDVLVIGAGAVGLAAGKEIAEKGYAVGLLEKNPGYGLETSSRNSEVIHSGIHYPAGSLKAELCVEGNTLLYEFCRANGILHKNTGKLTVAETEKEIREIERLYKTAAANRVPGVRLLDAAGAGKIAPQIKCLGGLFSPTTGIVNAHSLMDCLYGRFVNAGGLLAGFGEKVTAIEKLPEGFMVVAGDAASKEYTSKVVINCAGLFAGEVSEMLGLEYSLYWAKGDYFTIEQQLGIDILVYPVPGSDSLGIHLTPKMGGGSRLGPDIEYVEKKEPPYPVKEGPAAFTVDEGKKEKFYRAAKKFIPDLKEETLSPEMYGIRAKLQGPGEAFRDFIIREELPGFINLVGIESPGLTSCLSIARNVSKLLAGQV